MSKFYATIQGQAGEATRRGSASSGIRASVQSWNGSVITRLDEIDDKEILIIETSKDSKSCGDRVFKGSIKQFENIMEAVNRLGNQKALEILNGGNR